MTNKWVRLRVFLIGLIVFVLLIVGYITLIASKDAADNLFISYTADPKAGSIVFFWKDDNGELFRNIGSVKAYVENKGEELIFAMNGGMFKTNNSPQGLYIEQFKAVTPLDTSSGDGNFYLKPNGVFYLTASNTPAICKTNEFQNNNLIKYATQSGPMLVIDGEIHPAFKKGSNNLNIRNGVGILPNGKVVFIMSKATINFYDFATYFKSLGCKNALYLDGYVSKTYLPEKNYIQTDGDLGVIIGMVKKKNNSNN